MAALRTGWFREDVEPWNPSDPLENCVEWFTADQSTRFWRVLREAMLSHEPKNAIPLLESRISHHVRHGRYPRGLGTRLDQLIQSLPRSTRRVKLPYPLLPLQCCLQLAQLADDDADDQEDVYRLLIATRRAVPPATGSDAAAASSPAAPAPQPTDQEAELAVEHVLEAIDGQTLHQQIVAPLDDARASFTLESARVENGEQLLDHVTAFYRHILLHSRLLPIPTDPTQIASAGWALLEQAFAQEGGAEAAASEARHGRRGGLRRIFDQMVEHQKQTLVRQRVQHVLKEAIDPLDPQAKIAFTRALLARIGPQLPEDLKSQPIEQLAVHHERLVNAYVRCLDQLADAFRSL